MVGASAAAVASPTDHVIIAAMALSEHPNYSWLCLVDDQSSFYEVEGRTTAGVTWARLPMVSSVGRRLGRETDTQFEAIFHGRTSAVIRIGDAWKLLAELPLPRERVTSSRARTMMRGSASAGAFGIHGGPARGIAAPFFDRRNSRTFDALELGITHPHEELAIVVSSFTHMDVAGEIVTGTLSELGAALLLVRAEQNDVEPLASAGEFKLWLERGVVVKYQLKLEGIVAVGEWRKVAVHVNATTTLRDIGKTRIAVPDEAREKLRLRGSARL